MPAEPDPGDTIFSSMRGLPTTALVCSTLGACAQLAGIDKTSGDGRAGVSLTIDRASIGTTVIHAPQDLSANTATYLVASPDDPTAITEVVAEQTDIGLWTADIFQQTPPVLFDLPDQPGPPLLRLFDFPNADLEASFDVFEHPDPVISVPDALLTVNVTLDRPFVAEAFELFVVGTWTQIPLVADPANPTVLAPPAFAVSTMNAITQRPIEQITTADSALILRRTGPLLDGVVELTPFDQTGNDTLTGTMTAVAADQMLDLVVDPAAAADRFTAVRPAVTTPVFSWDLRAAPGAERANNLGPILDSGSVVMTDTAVQTAFGNPFTAKGWPAILQFTATETRQALPDGILPITLSAGMIQRVQEPTAGTVIDLPAGLPQLISIDGRSLSIDNVQISAPTAPVEITVVADGPPPTLSTLDVFQLVPNAGNTAFDRVLTLHVASASTTFHVPATTFVAGNYYTVRAQSVVGSFPNIADGDLATRDLPLSLAFADSGVFEVVP